MTGHFECKIATCDEGKHPESDMCEMHYLKRKHTDRIWEKYDEPLKFLLVQIAENNCKEWLREKPDTIGADEVRETGFTTNQQRWISEITGKEVGSFSKRNRQTEERSQ